MCVFDTRDSMGDSMKRGRIVRSMSVHGCSWDGVNEAERMMGDMDND